MGVGLRLGHGWRRHWQPHQLRRNYDETDWPQILALYGVLDRLADDPVVTLN